MALIYDTTMSPTKFELLASWLPSQPWFAGDPAALAAVGAYRFDDPAGAVGIEGHLITAGDDTVYHVPLTYRGAPLGDADAFLLGTSAHGVLGTRWISDASGDPVFRMALAAAIATGLTGAEEIVEDQAGTQQTRQATAAVQGSGAIGTQVPDLAEATVVNVGVRTRIENELAVLDLIRVVDPAMQVRPDQLSLQATWHEATGVLALLYAG
jgi:hypothetical protein